MEVNMSENILTHFCLFTAAIQTEGNKYTAQKKIHETLKSNTTSWWMTYLSCNYLLMYNL